MNTQAQLTKDHRPVYIQIAETLRARIVSGYYGDKIDGEIPLAKEWKVSRRTIQQALDILVKEGLLNRQHGMGTFVNRTGVEKRYRAITSITEGIAGQGLKPEFTVLSSGEKPASESEQHFFNLKSGDLVYHHKRLVLADRQPLAIVATSLNINLLEGLELSHLDGSLYAALRNQFGRTIVSAEDQYIPTIADAETARLLKIKKNSAIFVAVRRAVDQTEAPIELSHISMLPVPLDISIQHIGFQPEKSREISGEQEEWSYMVGFGNFRD